jgi:hypothetical protein
VASGVKDNKQSYPEHKSHQGYGDYEAAEDRRRETSEESLERLASFNQ